MPKFNTGQLYKTDGIDYAISEGKNYVKELIEIENVYECENELNLSNLSDFNLEEDDKIANEQALLNNERLLGAYLTTKGKVYIITEWDRSCTTILFAEEY